MKEGENGYVYLCMYLFCRFVRTTDVHTNSRVQKKRNRLPPWVWQLCVYCWRWGKCVKTWYSRVKIGKKKRRKREERERGRHTHTHTHTHTQKREKRPAGVAAAEIAANQIKSCSGVSAPNVCMIVWGKDLCDFLLRGEIGPVSMCEKHHTHTHKQTDGADMCAWERDEMYSSTHTHITHTHTQTNGRCRHVCLRERWNVFKHTHTHTHTHHVNHRRESLSPVSCSWDQNNHWGR